MTEADLVRQLAGAFGLAPTDPQYPALVNYYVALKAKPVVVLVGPAGNGKRALARGVAEAIVGQSVDQCQALTGHPWWATGPDGATAHTRWNEIKLDALAEEAAEPKNRHRAYFACLQQISPAELDELSLSASRPYPMFPPNLFIAATLDHDMPPEMDDGLPAVATPVWWPAPWLQRNGWGRPKALAVDTGRPLVKASVRRMATVRRRLRRLFSGLSQPTRALVEVTAILAGAGVRLPPGVMDDAMRYLANAWSAEGIGLFHPQPAGNLAVALDFVIAQTTLARCAGLLVDRPALRNALGAYLHNCFPYSAAWLAVAGDKQM
jgi:hypothetical protein